jgi:hypothetical protein
VSPLREAIRNKKPILEAEQVTAIFSDMEIIYSFNSQLLKDLTPIVQNWSVRQCLGAIFLKIMDFLKIYSGYIQNFNTALDVLHQCRKKSSIDKFLTECKDHPEANKLDLASYLIMPGQLVFVRLVYSLTPLVHSTSTVQRIPRYNLLLKV